MKLRIRHSLTLILCICMMLCLIFDGQTALHSATAGINICLKTVAPTLLPYIFLSSILCANLLGSKIPGFRSLGRLCGVPDGMESILLLGLIGGYPVGAKLVADAYHNGQLSKDNARRMIAFSNNAGPSFIFGILSDMFSNALIPWCLWSVHIISALIVGCFIPIRESSVVGSVRIRKPDVSTVLLQSIKTVAQICGWIILFRILLGFFDKWFLEKASPMTRVLLTGFLELANGCIDLHALQSEAIRLIISACILSFGGLCVVMQTNSVCGKLPFGMYIPAKVLQTVISLVLIIPMAYYFYEIKPNIVFFIAEGATILIFALCYIVIMARRKKSCGNSLNNVV